MNHMKTVLMAKPHPLIANHLESLLQDTGYTPIPLNLADPSASDKVRTATGAVISLAWFSEVTDSSEYIFETLREMNPYLPIVFTSDLDFHVTKMALAGSLNGKLDPEKLLPVSDTTASHQALGNYDTFINIRKADLLDIQLRNIAGKILMQHFQ